MLGVSYPENNYVFQFFQFYKARVELELREKIKCNRTNNGREYIVKEFDEFYNQEGIKKQFIIAYTQ